MKKIIIAIILLSVCGVSVARGHTYCRPLLGGGFVCTTYP